MACTYVPMDYTGLSVISLVVHECQLVLYFRKFCRLSESHSVVVSDTQYRVTEHTNFCSQQLTAWLFQQRSIIPGLCPSFARMWNIHTPHQSGNYLKFQCSSNRRMKHSFIGACLGAVTQVWKTIKKLYEFKPVIEESSELLMVAVSLKPRTMVSRMRISLE